MLLLTANLPAGETRCGQYIPLPRGRAVLVSPLDVLVYHLEIPRLRKQYREGAIRYQLKTLHPGDPADTELDYHIYRRKKGNETSQGVAAFASDKAVCRSYGDLNKALIPGIALMAQALRMIPADPAALILCTKDWVEIAGFTNQDLEWYRASRLPTGPSPDDPALASLIEQLAERPGADTLPVIIIEDEPEGNSPGPWQDLVREKFKDIRTVNLGNLAGKINIRKAKIYGARKKQSPLYHRVLIPLLILLNLGSLLFAFRDVLSQNEQTQDKLKKTLTEQQAASDEADALNREIAEYAAPPRPVNNRGPGAYRVIAALRECLGNAGIRSLLIQGNTFTVEAEGTDSMAALRALQGSADFSEPALRQAAPSKVRGDLFTITGNINHDKE